ncbi:MAG TPA: polysaccharide pyruvyl transferase family protein [Terriglobia bacterium]|nr:polysaccharide pyruvyl transferase family protein [Terriglobia bacterium]
MSGAQLKVGISGSYGGINLGDEAILHVMLSQLRQSLPVEVTVFTRNAEDTLRRHHVSRAVQFRELARREAQEIIAELDLFILGGGGILFDADADMYLREVLLAHEVGTPVMVYAISAGPLIEQAVRTNVREAFNRCAVITVRDRPTRQLLEDLGVEGQITVTADPAVLLPAEVLTRDEILHAEAIDPDARLIGFSVREPGPAAPDMDAERYHSLVANAADFMIDRLDAEVVFFPLERRNFDVQHSHGVVGQMRHAGRATVLKKEYTPGQIVSLLTRFQFAVGMRLHFLIFSALAGVPFTALPYASKVTGFLQELQIPAPSLEHVSIGELIAHIDRAWDERKTLSERIQSGLRDLQTRALANNKFVVRLLAESSPLATEGEALPPAA